jgi:transcriptional regulator with XRE-family HTH domain
MADKEQLILKRFGQKVKAIREQKGLSITEVAANCQLQRSKISLIESGGVNVTLLTIAELANGLEVEPKQLLNFTY